MGNKISLNAIFEQLELIVSRVFIRAARVTRFVTFVSRGIKITRFLIGLRKFMDQFS